MSSPQESNLDPRDINATTLYLKPLAGEISRQEIFNHFSAFGDVKNVRICAFVEFAQAESATRALEMESHTIAGHSVEVIIADDRKHQSDIETTLLNLNDDCRLEILSQKCLSAMDLCSVAETHPRLKEIAGQAFKRKLLPYTGIPIGLDGHDYRPKPAQRIKINFGSVISTLGIHGKNIKEKHLASVLESVATHCRNSLQSLCLYECVIPDIPTVKLKPMFNNLQYLEIESCTFKGADKELFSECRSLVELTVSRGVGNAFIFDATFPKLQHFDGQCIEKNIYDSFLPRHQNLISLKVWHYCGGLYADNCKRIEELEIRCSNRDTTCDLSNLVNLRKLRILDCQGTAEGLNNLKFLEFLEFNFVNLNVELFRALSQLKRLKVLWFENCCECEDWKRISDLDLDQLTELSILMSVKLDLVHLIKGLKNLKVLRVDDDLNLETFLAIVDLVKARGENSKLTLILHGPNLQHYDEDLLCNLSHYAHIVEVIRCKKI